MMRSHTHGYKHDFSAKVSMVKVTGRVASKRGELMNILHVSGVGNWGGGENHIQNLCLELAKTNPEVKNLILCVEGGQFQQKLAKLPIRYVTARRKSRIDHQFVIKIIQLCKREAIDLVHLHDPTAMQLAVIATLFARLPPFVLSRKISYPANNNFLSRYKYNHPNIKKYLCVSNETRSILARTVKNKSKLLTIYHGTNLDTKSDVTPFKLREKFAIPGDKKIIGNIANHYPAKDLPTLVRVVKRLVHEYGRQDFHVVQIGKPSSQTPEVMRLVREHELEPYITFLGFTENASNFIPQFDIGLMTSKVEGIPQVIYECFYYRKPVVTTNAGGIAEIIVQGETGFISERGGDSDLAKHLVQLLDQPELAETMVEKANKTLYSQFITPVMAQKTLAVYRDILGTR